MDCISRLDWIDTFISNVKPYIFVRLEDNLLIKRPNNATKLNPTGAQVLYSLLNGTPIKTLIKKIGNKPERTNEVVHFLFAVKHYLEGKLDEFTLNPAVEIKEFDMHFSQFPVLSEIALTYRCNLECRFCYAGCSIESKPENSTGTNTEMTEDEVKQILEKLYHDAKVPSVSFTGGEPLLVPFLPSLIRYAKKLGMRVNLISNGTLLTEKLAAVLADSGLDSAQISLEGVRPSTHDTIVHKNGAFQKTLNAIRLLKEKGIHTHTNTTINGMNLHECESFPAFVKNELKNDKFSMNMVIPTGNSILNPRVPVKYSQVGSIIKRIIAESNTQEVEFMWYSPVPMCMFNSILHNLGNKGCSACDGLISIAPNGDVLPCASCPDPVGNLLKQDFESTWQSVRASVYREKALAHPGCKTCENFHICNGACPLYWQHNSFEELIPYIPGKPNPYHPENLTND